MLQIKYVAQFVPSSVTSDLDHLLNAVLQLMAFIKLYARYVEEKCLWSYLKRLMYLLLHVIFVFVHG